MSRALQRAFTVAEAAAAYSVSETTIRRAVRKPPGGDGEYPPPLPAKRKGKDGKGPISIHVDALDEWHDALEDYAH